jgi:hypothetical protein
MDNPRTDQPAPHAGEKEKAAGPDGNRAPQGAPKDAVSPASKPQGTLEDQVKTMESEGQAQPQEGDLTPEELDDPMAGTPDRNPGRDNPGQRPMTDNKAGG